MLVAPPRQIKDGPLSFTTKTREINFSKMINTELGMENTMPLIGKDKHVMTAIEYSKMMTELQKDSLASLKIKTYMDAL